MRYLSLLIIATMFIAVGTAQDIEMTDEEMDQAQQFVNNYSEDLPGFLKSVIGDQRINTNIEADNDTIRYSATTEGITVENLTKGSLEDPTLVVNTSKETIEEISEAEDPAQKTRQKVKDDEITYESYGMFNQLKTFVMDLFF